MSTRRDVMMVAVPRQLLQELNEQWPVLRRDPAVEALRPRASASAAVRAALHLALRRLKAGEPLAPSAARAA